MCVCVCAHLWVAERKKERFMLTHELDILILGLSIYWKNIDWKCSYNFRSFSVISTYIYI